MAGWHDLTRFRWLPLLALLFVGAGCNLIRKPARLDVQPIEAFNPVKTQHIVVATITDEKGHPLRNREVEWMLEGVGSIVDVGGHFLCDRKEKKVDNHFAYSRTQVFEKKLDRCNTNEADDIVIKPGQAWCVITSPIEGDSHITVFAPGIANWDQHTVSVVKHWIDAEWRLPPPGTQPAGTPAVLTTQVYRFSDRRPLAGYNVRYRIIDGPPAVFLPSQTTEATAVTDLNGNAHITLAQASPANGVNRIAVEIIRSPSPAATSGTGIIVGRGDTSMEFVAPAVGLVNLAPASVAVGQEIPCALTVRNPGKVATQEITLRQMITEGLEYVRSEPPAIIEGNQLDLDAGRPAAGPDPQRAGRVSLGPARHLHAHRPGHDPRRPARSADRRHPGYRGPAPGADERPAERRRRPAHRLSDRGQQSRRRTGEQRRSAE